MSAMLFIFKQGHKKCYDFLAPSVLLVSIEDEPWCSGKVSAL